MTVIAIALKHLIAAGMSGDDLVRAVAEIEAELAAALPVEPDTRSPAAIRQANYRARAAIARNEPHNSDVTLRNDITDVMPVTSGRNGVTVCDADGLKEKTPQTPIKENSPPSPKGDTPKQKFAPEPLLAHWNAMAARTGLPKAIGATGKRLAGMRARVSEHGEDAFRQAIDAVARSKFLRGENDRGWRADLGFLLRPDNFVKLLEGGYGSDAEPAAGTGERVSPEQYRATQLARAETYDRIGRFDEAAEIRRELGIAAEKPPDELIPIGAAWGGGLRA